MPDDRDRNRIPDGSLPLPDDDAAQAIIPAAPGRRRAPTPLEGPHAGADDQTGIVVSGSVPARRRRPVLWPGVPVEAAEVADQRTEVANAVEASNPGTSAMQPPVEAAPAEPK